MTIEFNPEQNIVYTKACTRLEKVIKITLAGLGLLFAICLAATGSFIAAGVTLVGFAVLIIIIHKAQQRHAVTHSADDSEAPPIDATETDSTDTVAFKNLAERFHDQLLGDHTSCPAHITYGLFQQDAHTGEMKNSHIMLPSEIPMEKLLYIIQPYIGTSLQALSSVPLTILQSTAMPNNATPSDTETNEATSSDDEMDDCDDIDTWSFHSVEPSAEEQPPKTLDLAYQQINLSKAPNISQWTLSIDVLQSGALPTYDAKKALVYSNITIRFAADADEVLHALEKALQDADSQHAASHQLQLIDSDTFTSLVTFDDNKLLSRSSAEACLKLFKPDHPIQ